MDIYVMKYIREKMMKMFSEKWLKKPILSQRFSTANPPIPGYSQFGMGDCSDESCNEEDKPVIYLRSRVIVDHQGGNQGVFLELPSEFSFVAACEKKIEEICFEKSNLIEYKIDFPAQQVRGQRL